MKKTNSAISVLKIALSPQETLITDKNFQRLCDATSCDLSTSYKKQDSNYYHNNGETTSTITGRSMSLSVSIDYDSSNDVHKYLKDLIIGDFTRCNEQFIQLEIAFDELRTTIISGKTCFHFKSIPPSGAPDELIKIEFDIFPQDTSFTWETKLTADLKNG